jgi:hypothetical protein
MVLKEAPRTPTPGDNSLTIPSINNMSMSDKLKAWREREKRRKDDKENRMNSSNPGMVEKETKPRPKTPLPKGGMNLPKKTTFAYKSANRKLERKVRKDKSLLENPFKEQRDERSPFTNTLLFCCHRLLPTPRTLHPPSPRLPPSLALVN